MNNASSTIDLSVNQGLVHIAEPLVISLLVLDRSSSMERFGYEPLDATRGLIRDLQSGPDPYRVASGVILFDGTTTIGIPLLPVLQIVPDQFRYRNGIGTRLYGTVHDTLLGLLTLAADRVARRYETKVLVSVITDGADSTSRAMRTPCRTVAHQARQRGWELTVFGLGVPASYIAQDLGFSDAAQGVPNPTYRPAYDMDASGVAVHQTTTQIGRRTGMTTIGTRIERAPETPR